MKPKTFKTKWRHLSVPLVSLLIVALAIIGFTRCATIVHGPNKTVEITSQPTKAMVYIDDKVYGPTPVSVSLSRRGRLEDEPAAKKQYKVRVELEGYYPYEIGIRRTVDGWFFGNVLIGGFIGIIIDAATGSMYNLTPDQIIATMGTAPVNNDEEVISISVQLEVDPSWNQIGQLTPIEE